VRHRLKDTRYRIPDVAVFEHEPSGQVPSDPTLVAIEILSPDDRVGYIMPKLEEYRQWGVRHIWLADPENRNFFTCKDAGLHQVNEFSLPEYGIVLTLADIFGEK
jgi:Uma2 family endonuclease